MPHGTNACPRTTAVGVYDARAGKAEVDLPLETMPPPGKVLWVQPRYVDSDGKEHWVSAGVRPLISTGDPKKSVDISRKAELYETSSGMITITGGKLTTWRRMAKMAVDRIVEREGREAPCRTHEIPLGQAVEPDELPRVEGVRGDAYAMLAGRYGHTANDVLAIAAGRGELAQPIVPDGLI